MSRAAALLVLVLVPLGGTAACGGDDSPLPPREGDERRPDLPGGWERVVNRASGFNLGVPPGWRVRKGRRATLVRSADRALALSIAADRSDAGRELGPASYARRAVRRLPGYRQLRVGGARRLSGMRYPTAVVEARGTLARTGLRQRIEVFALQKRRVGTFTVFVFRSARTDARRYADVVDAIVRTLRAQRPAAGR